MRKISIVLALLALLAMAVMPAAAQDEDPGTIADIVVASATGETPEFATLLTAVQAADPAVLEALSDPEAEFTVFAPTDAAFAALAEELGEEAFGEILADTEALTGILLFHVVEGAAFSTDVVSFLEEGDFSVESLNGQYIDIAGNVEDGITVDGANLVLEMVDIEASNGVIHVIDAVLVPPITLPEVEPGFVEGDITSAGSSTVGPLTQRIADNFIEAGYAASYTNAIIGSGAGFERFCEAGETDFSNASRAIREGEIESCREIGREPIEIRVGTDAIAVAINPANDFATDVTLEELALLFSTAESWSDVRSEWPDETIIRYFPGTDSGTFDFFVEEVFEEDESPLLNASNGNPNENDDVLVAGVQDNPFAVGFFGFAFFTQNEDTLNALALDGVSPNQASVDAGTYPLARPLFVYADAGIIEEKPQVGQFLSYYLSNVNNVIGEVGYFPANPFALNIAKLEILALTDGMMGGM